VEDKRYIEVHEHIHYLQNEIEELSTRIAKVEEMTKLIDDMTDKIAYLQGKLGTLTDRAATARQDIDYLMHCIGELRNKKQL